VLGEGRRTVAPARRPDDREPLPGVALQRRAAGEQGCRHDRSDGSVDVGLEAWIVRDTAAPFRVPEAASGLTPGHLRHA
jgi:hypothetical protein